MMAPKVLAFHALPVQLLALSQMVLLLFHLLFQVTNGILLIKFVTNVPPANIMIYHLANASHVLLVLPHAQIL